MTTYKPGDGDATEVDIGDESIIAPYVAVANLNGPIGYPDVRTITFNAAGDLPADETAITVGELITLNTYDTGKKRVRVTFHSTAAGTNIPFAGSVGAVVNGTPGEAVAKLSITDVSEGGTGSAENGGRLVSQTQPVIEFALDDSTADIDTVYLVGYAPGGTGAAIVKISVEVW